MKTSTKAPRMWKSGTKQMNAVLNHEWYKIVSELQSDFVKSTINFYQNKDFKFIMLPVTTGSISSPMGLGSDSIPVKIKIQGIDTYLADSMQFFLEIACRIHKQGVYYISPSFRGEKADERHLSQFYHSEAEIIGDLEDVIELCQDYLKFITDYYLNHHAKEIFKITGTLNHLESLLKKVNNIPRCSFDDAAKILKHNKEFIIEKPALRVINSKGEKELIKHFEGFVWLTHFDHLSVPFYQKYYEKDSSKALNADLLMGIGETIGAGERHLTDQDVTKSLKLHQTDKKPYEWYINLKKQVQVQTSGFGMGIERYILWLLMHEDIRDIQIIPRFNGVISEY